MSPQDAKLLIANGESLSLELKEQLDARRPEKICKEIAALASMQGGNLFVGVRDDGYVCGVDNPKRVQNQIENVIAAHIEPLPIVQISLLTIDDRNVVCAAVQTGIPPVYFYDGRPYWRIGTSSVPAGPTEVERLIRNSEVSLELRRQAAKIASMTPEDNVAAAIIGQGELATINYEELKARLIKDLSEIFISHPR
ncbi:MAG: ATP-binding protein [Hyphomonas sp.]